MSTLLEWLSENESTFRKTRLPSLYSDLSVQKATNPEGYAANVTAWQAALTQAALHSRLPEKQVFRLDANEALLDALASPRYGRPTGLGLVLDEGVRTGKFLDLKDFVQAEHSIYQRSWVPSPWAVLKWSLRQAGLVGSGTYDVSGHLRPGQLVIVAALEAVCKQVMARQEERGQGVTDRIMTKKAFVDDLSNAVSASLSEQDIEIFLRYLSRDKGLLTYDAGTVKFKPTKAAALEPITQEDTTIASLKSLMANLESQIQDLERRITTLQSTAQAAVQRKSKQSALSALKSKKLAERSMQQRMDTLHQLEEVYSKIEQAVDQIEVVETMQASASTLRSLNQRIGGVEHVDHVVEDLRAQMSEVDEVGHALEEPLNANAAVDEAEVDEELEAMEREQAEALETKEAERTRQRLEELDRVEAHVKADTTSKQEDATRMQSSIEQLDRMSIDDKKATNQSAQVLEST